MELPTIATRERVASASSLIEPGIVAAAAGGLQAPQRLSEAVSSCGKAADAYWITPSPWIVPCWNRPRSASHAWIREHQIPQARPCKIHPRKGHHWCKKACLRHCELYRLSCPCAPNHSSTSLCT